MLSYARHAPTAGQMPITAVHAHDDPIVHRVLDRLGHEIVVLDEQGGVVFCNERARQLMAANRHIGVSRTGHLHFLDRGTQEKFRNLLSMPAKNMQDEGETLLLQTGLGDPPHAVSLRALDGESSPGGHHFLLTFSGPGASPPEVRMRQMMLAFGLTPAEQRLTRYLSAGGRLSGAADAFNLSRHTVRNQLRAVFDKVGVRRQTELTRLLWGGCSQSAVS